MPGRAPGSDRSRRRLVRCPGGTARLVSRVVLLVGAFWGGGLAAEGQIQELDSIRQAVESFVAAQTPTARGERAISVTNLDKRLRLQACTERMETFFPAGSRSGPNRTVGVSCSGPKPWTIYVSVQIRYRAEVWVAVHALPKGAVISAADLVLEEQDLDSGPYGYISDQYQAIGKRTRQPLRSGTPITASALEAIPSVVRGQKVWLVAESPYLLVRMSGTALQNGAAGDRIRVENPRSKRVVEGIVGDDGTVKIPL